MRPVWLLSALGLSLGAALVLIAASVCAAQEGAGISPPPIIEVVTVDGRDQAVVARLLRVAARSADPPFYWIATSAVAGDETGKAVFLTMHPNYKSLQNLAQALLPRGEQPTIRAVVFERSAALSFNTGLVPWGAATAYEFRLVTVRRGATDDYIREQRYVVELLEKAKLRDEEFIVYGLKFGGQIPGFLFLTPRRSLDELDTPLAPRGDLFTPEADRRRSETLRASVISDVVTLLVVRPEASYPPRELREQNPGLWRTSMQ